MKRQVVLPPPLVPIGLRIAELHDAVNCSEERNSNGERWYRRTWSLCRSWNAAKIRSYSDSLYQHHSPMHVAMRTHLRYTRRGV